MVALLIEHIKVVMLLSLVGSIIVVSQLNGAKSLAVRSKWFHRHKLSASPRP
jgi:hypothetical protein